MGLPVSRDPQPNEDDGGGGDMTDLTRRVTALEETMARLEPLLIRIDERLNHVATKGDLEALRADTDIKMESLRGDMDTKLEVLRADLRAGLAEKPGRFFMVGTVMTVFGLCAAIVAATVAGLQYIQPLP
jgi:hypothetical protein